MLTDADKAVIALACLSILALLIPAADYITSRKERD